MLKVFIDGIEIVLSIILQPFVFVPLLLYLTVQVIILVIRFIRYLDYKKSSYFRITKLPYFQTTKDEGRFGEYQTYKYLKKFESRGAKFLFNIYIPKENGETTEIDILMICSGGIFVFESKNYSGWIFGNESQLNWCQTLPQGKGKSHKEHFYNPIMQNRTHLKCLDTLLDKKYPMHSIIVFSERCNLKKIQLESDDVYVIKRKEVVSIVSRICKQTTEKEISENTITEIYNILFPYTQVDKETKEQHIININKKTRQQPVQYNSDEHKTDNKSELYELSEENNVVFPKDKITTDIENNTEKEQTDIESKILKCPKCNGNLILRNATKGNNAGKRFYGCSNFPKCRYIQKID